MDNINLLISSLPNEGDKWVNEVTKLLRSSTLEQKQGTPMVVKVDFILKTYSRRISSSVLSSKDYFGVKELISTLQSINKNEEITSFGLKNSEFTGECFLKNGLMIGCAFIRKGLSNSTPGISL